MRYGYCSETNSIEVQHIHQICSRTRTVPYLNQTSKSKFSKTTRQNLIKKSNSNRERLTLPDCIFIFIFCRRNFEKISLELWLKYGTDTVREQIRWKCCNLCYAMLNLEVVCKCLKKSQFIMRFNIFFFRKTLLATRFGSMIMLTLLAKIL